MRHIGSVLVALALVWTISGCGPSLSSQYGFGAPRSQIKGNPLAEQIDLVHKSEGPKAALAFANERTLIAMFPFTSDLKSNNQHNDHCIRPAALTTSDDSKALILIPNKKNLPYAHAICQSLGYESAYSVRTSPVSKAYKLPTEFCGKELSAASYSGTRRPIESRQLYYTQVGNAGSAPGGSEVDGHRLNYSRGNWQCHNCSYKFTQLSDPMRAVISDKKCAKDNNGRMRCPTLNLSQSKEVFAPDWRKYRVIHLLQCTNANPGSLAAIRRAKNAVTLGKYAPKYTSALRGYRSTKSRHYLKNFRNLLRQAPMGNQADEAREILSKAHLKDVIGTVDFSTFNILCHALWLDIPNEIDMLSGAHTAVHPVVAELNEWAAQKTRNAAKQAFAKCRERYKKLNTFCHNFNTQENNSQVVKKRCAQWHAGLRDFRTAKKQNVEETAINAAFNAHVTPGIKACIKPSHIRAEQRSKCSKWNQELQRARSSYNRKLKDLRRLNVNRVRAGYRVFPIDGRRAQEHLGQLTSRQTRECMLYGFGASMRKRAQEKWRALYSNSLNRCKNRVGQSWINRAKELATTDSLKAELDVFLDSLPAIKEALRKASQ